MRNVPYNSKSTQIDEEFSKMVQKELELGHMAGGTIANMFDSLTNYKMPKQIFLVHESEIFWDDNEIKVYYHSEDLDTYNEDNPDMDIDNDRISIPEFCSWMRKNKHNFITHEGHKHNGVFDQWTRTYEPEDLLRDPIFDLNYHLELFLSDRGY